MAYIATVKLVKHKKILWLVCASIILIASYAFYALKFNEISYIPNYQAQKIAKYSAVNFDLGPYPASIRLADQELEINNSESKLPMASTVKLITALSLADKIGIDNLNKTITLGPEDNAITQDYINKGGSVVRFNNGHQLTYKQALEYMLVVSANNFADILVNRQFASSKEYLNYANQWLANKNIKNTVVYDASGFSPQTVTSPSDLTSLGAIVANDDILSAIVNKKSTSLPSGINKASTNYFLYSNYGTTTGIKTGNTDEAKFVFVTSIESAGKPTIISAVMQAPNRGVSQQQAINNADILGATYTSQELFAEDSTVLKVNLPWAQNLPIIASETISLKNIANQPIEYVIELMPIAKDTQAGQMIGKINAVSVLEQKSTNPLLNYDYPGINQFWLLTHPLY